MNGAESLVKTFLANGVDTVFANPGTSEMHFVAALDAHPEMRCILCLFEGGASGAADAYYRMSGKVAGTLLHLAPGFGNAYANLHNARKAQSGVVNVVGDHATHHLRYESPLKGDVVGVSQSVSHWTRLSPDARSVAGDGSDAIRAARSENGQVATLILPANTAWEDAEAIAVSTAPPMLARPSEPEIEASAHLLTKPGAVLLIGGTALHGELRQLAGRIAAKTGCRLMSDTLVARQSRGAGVAMMDPLPYPVDPKIEALKGTRSITLVGSNRPVAFFAYPGKPSKPEPEDCTIDELCTPVMDIGYTLQALADACAVDAQTEPRVYPLELPDRPTGPLDLHKVGQAIAALLPENAIICNESITSGFQVMPHSLTARSHDMIGGTGGSIGLCLPSATGAAAACPDRKVLALTGDGSAMYTLQSLWTMAREQQDVTVVVFANKGYQILRDELANVGVESYGRNAQAMFDVVTPELDWVALSRGHGVPAVRVITEADAFVDALEHGLASDGPSLIEVVC